MTRQHTSKIHSSRTMKKIQYIVFLNVPNTGNMFHFVFATITLLYACGWILLKCTTAFPILTEEANSFLLSRPRFKEVLVCMKLYRKSQKLSPLYKMWKTTRNFLKFWTLYSILFWPKLSFLCNCTFLKILCGLANSVDPDQTAPLGAVWSGYALFACVILSDTLVFEILGHLPYSVSSPLN